MTRRTCHPTTLGSCRSAGPPDVADDPKDNSVGGVAAAQLRAYVQRIERLQEEQDAIGQDKKEVYAEAKATGFDKKTLKRMVARRRQDRSDREEGDALLDLYEAAIATLDAERRDNPQDRDPLD